MRSHVVVELSGCTCSSCRNVYTKNFCSQSLTALELEAEKFVRDNLNDGYYKLKLLNPKTRFCPDCGANLCDPAATPSGSESFALSKTLEEVMNCEHQEE